MNAPAAARQPTNLAALRAPQEASMPAVRAGFFDLQSFELMQRVSKAFSASDLVPQQYRGSDKIANCMIAMDMAQRMGANPLMVMQNLYIVHGTPSWSSKFLIATINASGRYSSLRYEWKGEPGKPDYGCRAWAVELATGERLDGIWVTWDMVNAEGWSKKNGSKWLTMPDQMFVYRAAAFWQRAYAPELGMGLQTVEDVHDGLVLDQQADGTFTVSMDDLRAPQAAQQPRRREREATQAELTLEQKRAKYDEALADYGEKEAENFMPRRPRPDTYTVPHDAETGEIHDLADTKQQDEGGPSFADAHAAVRAGDFDVALDIASSLTAAQRQQIKSAIDNMRGGEQQAAEPAQRRGRQRGSMDLG